MPEKCEYCKCYKYIKNPHHGYCRRYPPENGASNDYTGWTFSELIKWTRTEDWCGEWRAK